MEHILSKKLVKPLPIFSHATTFENLIFTSCVQGFLANESVPKEIDQEATQMFKNLEALLIEAGSDLSRILKLTMFFLDLERDFLPVNKVFNQFFKDKPPARSSIGVSMLPRGCKVVVECIAIKTQA